MTKTNCEQTGCHIERFLHIQQHCASIQPAETIKENLLFMMSDSIAYEFNTVVLQCVLCS